MDQHRQQIHNRITVIFRDIFEDETLELYDGMTAADIEEWDSLTHITIVVTCEKEFGIKLNAAEIGKLKTVGEFINTVAERTA
jgi:Phosphopantetheine attachment site.